MGTETDPISMSLALRKKLNLYVAVMYAKSISGTCARILCLSFSLFLSLSFFLFLSVSIGWLDSFLVFGYNVHLSFSVSHYTIFGVVVLFFVVCCQRQSESGEFVT